MFKIFKKDRETTPDEEWLSILKEDGVNLTATQIKKARKNDGQALYNIGRDYFNNKKDNTKAFAWFYKAALENYSDAQYAIGLMYRYGHGVSQDYKLAMEWFQKADSNGDTDAQNGIGYLYDLGLGVSQNYELAMHWYMKAASNGNDSAQSNVGGMYEHGRGVTKSVDMAIEWYQKASDNNNKEAKVALERLTTQRNDAIEEHTDKETPANEEWPSTLKKDGVKLTQEQIQKARENDGETLYNIGWDYYKNNKYYTKAFTWFHKAALQNYSDAQYQVGSMFKDGHGVPQDYHKAVEWYQKAASNGNPDAQYNIGSLYENGHGITKDIAIAIEWYKAAADNNNEEAKEALERLSKEGNDANDDHKEKENTNIKDTRNDNAATITHDEQTHAPTSTNSNEDHINKLINDKMKGLADAFELKLGLAEKENQANKESRDAMQRNFDILQQEKLRQDEENKQLKEKLTRLEAQLEENSNNDLNYDSAESVNDNDTNNDTADNNTNDDNNKIHYDSPDDEDTEENSDNDSYYDTEIDKSTDDNSDINYDSECSDDEEDINHNTSNNALQNTNRHVTIEEYADLNYNSSDNEDLNNDICYDGAG